MKGLTYTTNKKLFSCLLLLSGVLLFAQEKDWGTISGNFQTDVQYYIQDTIIDPSGEADPDERVLANSFLNLTYQRQGLSVGVRYESFQNNRVGLQPQYQGEGIMNRYVRYQKDAFDLTVGNYYEQFGSGLFLRTYWEWGLGLDNALDGVRLIYQPVKSMTVKALDRKSVV